VSKNTTKTVTLADYLADQKEGNRYLWINRVIGGADDFTENLEGDGEDYCDLDQIVSELEIGELEGELVNGRWEWNGEGKPTDWNGTSIVHVKAGFPAA
jgi:hypothetical protein